MSNLSGNYKISAGEVQGVDVVREQERRARLQLLDGIREPSPQPIFGEPVKVELEDETSRRIKNTLGDFTQVLINDSKNLLGIARSSSNSSGHGQPQSGRGQPTNKRPPINGMYKPSHSNIPKHPAPDKRLGYPRNKPHEPPITIPPTSLHNADSRLKDSTQWSNSHQRKPGAPPSLNGNSQSASYNSSSYNRVNPSFCPNLSTVPSNKSYPFQAVNGSMSNTVSQAPRYGESSSSAAPPKRIIFRPSILKLPERKPEKPAESPIELETILREMKQAVPPPLTAIQTPRTEESGFAFPIELPKEDVLLTKVKELKLIKTPEPVPQPPDPPKSKEINSRQSTSSPLKKPLTHVFNEPVAVDNMPGHKTNVEKELDNSKLGRKVPQKMETNMAEPEVIEINSPLETEKATELLVRELSGQSWSDSCRAVGLLNEPDKCISSSLQDDLEMSDSDDEAVTEIKSTPAEFPKSPINTSSVIPNTSSTTANTSSMDVPQAVPSNSSSSESGDSDSDDSSSESNDSDSSASSEASDADTPSKMWGLSNFFDESRRNHSPAFVPNDTSTNSSTAAVKEEPIVVPTNPRESYSHVDDDLGNDVLQVYANDLKDYLNVPLADPIPNFLELDTPVNIKSEILSPIPSPLQPSGPSAPQPSAIRGPRTPPSPSYPPKDDSREIKKSCVSSGNVQTEASISVELTVPQSQISKHSNVQQSSCDTKEDTGKVQISTARKLRLSKNKNEMFSPRNESSPATQSVEDDEPSASKGLYDASFNKDNVNIDINVMTSSCSVPSETSESSHENYSIKTRQKVSKSSSAKKAKILSEESLCDSGQKENTSSKSPISKFKHPTRTCRASNETKQLSKTVKSSAKSDIIDEVKKPISNPDLKDKNSSEKTKITLKTVGNTKGLSKNSVKIKKKPQKISPKQILEEKKVEVKRKKNKFHIENFLQSPTISQSETGQLSKVSSFVSPSRDKSPIPDYKSSSDSKRKPSVSPSRSSQSPSKLSTIKSAEKGKNVEKLRRSARCSERASSIAQAESSVVFQDTELTKKSTKRTPKRREPSDSPARMEAPPLLLSPIPHMSPIPMTSSECAIPDKIMVCIPLDKLSRLPIPMHAHEAESKSACKSKPIEEILKDIVLLEKSSKNTTNKRAVLKDIKDKPRTDSNSKSTKNKSSTVKKDKNVKTVSAPLSTSLSKTATSVNSKTSIKTIDGKPSLNASEIKISKKRKSEDEKQLLKKKPKIYSEQSHDRNQHMSSRTESPNHTDTSSKSKGLERCDSVSSLSSLGSQMSQRSSKEKKSSTSVADTKRGKSLPVKHIKQEKEEKVKTVIKKEPGTPDKKEKSRDKLISKDPDQKPLLEPLWSDTSSQYCPWDDPCKEDSKGTLPIASSLLSSITRVCGFDWDHFGPEGKDKESSNKHNNPIMPMDYYYTEGRKQRHLAEREKDPFLQTLKYFEATVLFILTSQQREEYTKEPESVYQFYRETLNFSNVILQNVRIQQSSPGSTEFKLLILLLRCQALLNVKLYNLKIKEIKEQQKNVADFFQTHCPNTVKSLSHPTPPNPRLSLTSVPSPHSPTPSPASSVNSQTSGYSSSDISGNHMRNSLSLLSQSVNVTQSMLEMICRQHTHLYNLHMGHDLWEQADMYMTRSNLREFFKEVADQSENLTLHSSIKDLVNYVQTGISLVKKCSR